MAGKKGRSGRLLGEPQTTVRTFENDKQRVREISKKLDCPHNVVIRWALDSLCKEEKLDLSA